VTLRGLPGAAGSISDGSGSYPISSQVLDPSTGGSNADGFVVVAQSRL
jgi:hypothetical protein